MASSAFQSNEGRQNFQRLTRLLIAGATITGREIFDAIHPPATLATVLADPARQAILRGSRMTRPQWTQLYPSPGTYGKSKDWDLTLLQKMLRSICGLTQPTTGWDDLPLDSDISKEADLVRLKYYRNSVYGHVDERMEINDEQFQKLWKNISKAIIRLAGHLSYAKKKEWEDAIEDFLTAPLTSDDLLNVEELKSWYRQDVEMRDELTTLKGDVRELIERLPLAKQRSLDPNVDTCIKPHHENQLVEWFCEACRECVCRTCVTLNHTTHPCVNMNDPTHMQTVTQELLDTSQKVRCEIEKHKCQIREINKNSYLRKRRLNKLKDEISTTVKEWIEQLREQEQKLHKDIETTEKVYQDNDDSQVSDIIKHVEKLEAWMTYTEKLANEGSAVNKVTEKEKTLKSKDKLLAEDLQIEPKIIAGCLFIVNGNLSRELKDFGTISLWDCVAEGQGLKKGVVSVRSAFTVKTNDVHCTQDKTVCIPTTLNVKITSSQGSVDPAIQSNKDGTFTVSFVPTHPGDHKISATLEDQEIPGSPFIASVNHCTLTGEGLTKGIVGLRSHFKICFQVLENGKVYEPIAVLSVNLRSPVGNLLPSIQDNKDGTYSVSFVPTHPGEHYISVSTDGQEILSSRRIAKISQYVIKGEGLSKGVVGLRSQFMISSQGPNGENANEPTMKLNVEIRSPQGALIQAIENKKDGTYLVSFFPVQSGDYQIFVYVRDELSESEYQEEASLSAQEVPGSPFTVAVTPRVFRAVLSFGKKGKGTDQMSDPVGVTVNEKDQIIVSDYDNDRVQVFSSKGEHLATIGSKEAGTSEFNRPCGVEVSEENNNIIVVDKICRVQIFTETGEFIRSFGSEGRDNGQLVDPTGLALDTDGNIIVTDCGSGQVKVFSWNGVWMKSFDCGGRPDHCVAHGDRYYVSSYSDDCIKVFDKSGTFLCEYGARGSSPGEFSRPTGLAVDKAGNLIVCDSSNNRVQVLQMDGTFVGSFGVRGEGMGQFSSPDSVAVMKDGKIVVCDGNNNRIHIFE